MFQLAIEVRMVDRVGPTLNAPEEKNDSLASSRA
jgi:hypothetical protein